MLEDLRHIKEDIESARDSVRKLGLDVGDNVYLLCYALEKTKNLDGIYMECGVFKGSTLLTANEFCKRRKITTKFVGCDTFEGFPKIKEQNPKDLPEMFGDMFESGKISKAHYDLCQTRLSSLSKNQHLSSDYFANTEQVVFSESVLRSIRLVKGEFSETLKEIREPISVLHIDCDLYDPYKVCLESQFENIVSGGFIVFDEYYSLKYPGARLAVDDFLSTIDSASYELMMHMTGDFERWYVQKK